MAATDEPSTPEGGVGLLDRTDTSDDIVVDKGWTVLLWNDPVNLFEVVRDQLIAILEIGEDLAHEYTKTAHEQGKAAVFNGGKDKALLTAEKLGSVGLWATVERAS